MTKMSETVNQKSKYGYGRHPHHLFRIPVADATTHECTAEEKLQTTEPSADLKKPVGNGLTAVIRGAVNKCGSMFVELQKSQAYKALFFAQSAHVMMALAVILVASSLMPSDPRKSTNVNNGKIVKPRTLVYFVYIAAFSMHMGFQVWMTFISGLALYFNLSRHAFGDVQKILFPKYFSINSMLSAITLVQFGKMHVTANVWNLHTYLQLLALSFCFLLELIIRLYVVPPVLQLITAKTAIEKSAGMGNEVGRCDLGPLINCPHYMTIHRTFRKAHMFMAIGNVITMMCSIFHLTYIAA